MTDRRIHIVKNRSIFGALEPALSSWMDVVMEYGDRTQTLTDPEDHDFCLLAFGTLPHWLVVCFRLEKRMGNP